MTEPAPRECVACYVARMLADQRCDGTLTWATAFRDHSSPTATGLERRMANAGGTCDCAILSHGYQLARHLMVRDLRTDELEPPPEQPVCAGVGRTSSRPCANWERRQSPTQNPRPPNQSP